MVAVRYGLTDVVPIAADRRPDGTLAYLSTDGAAAGVAMPDRYDPESGQPWTRSRTACLPADYAARIPLLINGIPRR
ncbi:hypothetical protein [Nocardia terpenica]|uniref:Uncharacterized protein n=1 Tax=Nocardia terpenica TaxID=455432 RepID=A0A6G9Z7B3_9NOCA|nr:hypothetical protein [Nocardia terpenica]QIS21340.1 hypothetical protein F6W96_26425 [Nocardia terpenica]